MERIAALGLAALASLSGQEGREPVRREEAVVGQVVDTSGGPVPGVPVRLSVDHLTVERTVSDSAGRFELSPREGSLKVEVSQLPGRRIERPERRVEAGVPIRFVSRVVATVPFRGVAIDVATGQPSPHTAVRVVERHGPSEVCTTDGLGRFTTATEFALGSLTILAWDDFERRPSGQSVVHRDLTGAEPPVRCLLRIGTRRTLDCALPAGSSLADYRAELRAAAQPPCARGRSVPVTLHEGDPPWIRPTAVRPGQVLHLLGRDGFSGARVDARRTGPLQLDPRPLGAVVVQVAETIPVLRPRAGSNAPEPVQVRSGVTLKFDPLPAGGQDRVPFETRAPVGRPRRVAWIEPGRWSVEVTSRYFPPTTVEVAVLPGTDVPLEARLPAPIPTGTIRVRVVDPGRDIPSLGDDAPTPTASVEGASASYRIETVSMCGTGVDTWFQRVRWNGCWVLEATLHDVPAGTYRVAPRADRPLHPSHVDVRPGETAEFRF